VNRKLTEAATSSLLLLMPSLLSSAGLQRNSSAIRNSSAPRTQQRETLAGKAKRMMIKSSQPTWRCGETPFLAARGLEVEMQSRSGNGKAILKIIK
jgi:hypothetical protein